MEIREITQGDMAEYIDKLSRGQEPENYTVPNPQGAAQASPSPPAERSSQASEPTDRAAVGNQYLAWGGCSCHGAPGYSLVTISQIVDADAADHPMWTEFALVLPDSARPRFGVGPVTVPVELNDYGAIIPRNDRTSAVEAYPPPVPEA